MGVTPHEEDNKVEDSVEEADQEVVVVTKGQLNHNLHSDLKTHEEDLEELAAVEVVRTVEEVADLVVDLDVIENWSVCRHLQSVVSGKWLKNLILHRCSSLLRTLH